MQEAGGRLEIAMEEYITIKLSRNDVGQIIDGLYERMIIWKTTAEYLRNGHLDCGGMIEECSEPEEAENIADHYEKIINQIKAQL